jgi:hypothetical protein
VNAGTRTSLGEGVSSLGGVFIQHLHFACANNNEMMASNGQNDNKETIELVSWRDIALESRTYNRKRGAHRAFHVEPVLSWKSNVEAFPSFVSDNGESRLTDVLPEYPPNPIDSRLSPRGIPDPAVWSVPQK